jgi:TetR/AcrR family transcriptional regulator
MAPPQKRDPEATRAAILEAAQAIFVDKGFADASVSAIARRAGVTKSLIHHHFGSKDGLWDEVKTHSFAEYAAAQRRILDEPDFSAELLRRSVVEYFRFLERNPQFPRLVHWMHLEEEDHCFAPAEKLTEMGMEKIRLAQENGELRDDLHPFFMLVSFLGLAMHWFQTKHHHCQWAPEDHEVWDDENYLEAMQKIFFEGVLPRES